MLLVPVEGFCEEFYGTIVASLRARYGDGPTQFYPWNRQNGPSVSVWEGHYVFLPMVQYGDNSLPDVVDADGQAQKLGFRVDVRVE